MLRLENRQQAYAWGSHTAIPRLFGWPETGGPIAELWLGAHPSAPSTAGGVALDQLIAASPEKLLGPDVVARFGPTLPFLLKVLAAAKPLSLQAHPSRAQAQAGFARENAAGVPLAAAHRNYKDPNHKPELICALTPFRALCGFRDVGRSAALFSGLAVSGLQAFVAALKDDQLPRAFELAMRLPREVIADVRDACARRPVRGLEAECANAVVLADAYPGDVGVVGALLLNLVTLSPGEALALGAGNLHAYLEGTGIELMANSDNVLRGGLTPKHVDLDELLRVLDFGAGPVEVLRASGAPEAVYTTRFEDFRLSRVDVHGALELGRRGPDLVLCVEGEVTVNGLALTPGGSAFAGADEGPLRLAGRGRLFRATVNS